MFVLFVTVVLFGSGVHTNKIEGFKTKESCENASLKIKKDTYGNKAIDVVCIEVK